MAFDELSVWVVSWNCENDEPSDEILEKHFVAADLKGKKPDEMPDVIAIGLQEAKTSRIRRMKGKKKPEVFVAERLLAYLKNDKGEQLYKQVSQPCTKPAATKWPKQCVIQLGILVKKDLAPDMVQGVYQTKGKAKGGVCTVLTLEKPNVAIAFANCHLESKTGKKKGKGKNRSDKRNKQIVKVIERVVQLAGGDQEKKKKEDGLPNIYEVATDLDKCVDVVFFFGDLNYRLYPRENAAVLNHLELGFDEALQAGNINIDIHPQALTQQLAYEDGRKRLFLLDGLAGTDLVDDDGSPIGGQFLLNEPNDYKQKGFGFTFPPPTPKFFLPTYKLDYKTHPDGSKKHKGESAAEKLDSKSSNPSQDDILEAYFRRRGEEKEPDHKKFKKHYDAKAKQKGRKGALELGWLDRVGYRVSKARADVEVGLEEFSSYEGFRLSDHAPVVLKCKVVAAAKQQRQGRRGAVKER
jgi:hypothetical protein